MNYVKFAEVYDKFSANPKLYKTWLNYIKKRTIKVKTKRVLDLACGTGNLTIILSKKYDVTGLDKSKYMLNVLKKRSKNKIKTICTDFTNFKASNFDLIISSYDSINYITNINDLIKTFKNIYNALNKNGIFIFDINPYDKVIFNSKSKKSWRKTGKYFILDEHKLRKNLWIIKLKIFEPKNNKFLLFEETHIERAYKLSEIKKALQSAKFKKIQITDGAFNKPQKKTMKRLFFTCHK